MASQDPQGGPPVASAASPTSLQAASPPAANPPVASPPAATSPAELQPPQFWTEQGLPAEDTDDNGSAFGDAESSTASLSSSILKYRVINGRTFHSERESIDYWAPNDDKQNEVLDIQHHVFSLAQDGKLYQAPLSENIGRVLDIGTGTGIWAIDFGDEHPEATVIATDISPIQPSWAPPNVCFEIDDFTQEWTYKENSFDYVHMRWLVGGVSDWEALFKQAWRVLKPGGWIESLDIEPYFQTDDDTMPATSAMAQWGSLFQEGLKAMGSKASFMIIREQLQRKAMEAAGFARIQEKLMKIPTGSWPKDSKQREIGLFTKAALDNDVEGTCSTFASRLGWSQEEVIIYAAHIRREARQGRIHGYYTCNAVWAQKPLDN